MNQFYKVRKIIKTKVTLVKLPNINSNTTNFIKFSTTSKRKFKYQYIPIVTWLLDLKTKKCETIRYRSSKEMSYDS
jgi:hypothetical protein